jgi:hypothetical protein
MKYKVSIVSGYNFERPCKEAFESFCECWHTRCCTEEYFDLKFSESEGTWRSKGANHKITADGYITRQHENIAEWCVEINTLEELNTFIATYGDICIFPSSDGVSMIEIYDDYRE